MDIAIAIIERLSDGAILIARRHTHAHQGGLWEFPGGKCRVGENPRDCALREALEETGLTVSIVEGWPPVEHDYTDRKVTLYPFLCRSDSSEAEARESQVVVWALPSELSRYDFPEANQPWIERLQKMG